MIKTMKNKKFKLYCTDKEIYVTVLGIVSFAVSIVVQITLSNKN